MYATSSEHTRVPWAAHSYNVAFSDEIGHFEYCDRANPHGKCVNPAPNDKKEGRRRRRLLQRRTIALVQIGGCIATDNDFDGVSYQTTWPGSLTDPAGPPLNPTSVLFSSPTFGGGQNYEPRRRSRRTCRGSRPPTSAGSATGTPGADCVNPPPGSNFYPFYSTRSDGSVGCFWQVGGAHIPGTTNTFGGNSAAEFGPLLFLDYPGPGFTPIHRTNDFRQVLETNPCPSEVT